MKRVFGDTHFYIALINPADPWHGKASEWMANSDLWVLTSEFVLLEVANALSPPPQRRQFPFLLQRMRTERNIRLIRATQGLFNDAAELYGNRLDKSWSLVDCSSFVLMHRFKLRDALTADHHYEQAGFRALLR